MAFSTKILIHLYSLCTTGVATLFRLTRLVWPNQIQRKISPRLSLSQSACTLSSGSKPVLFFASSAGEFEQARPVMNVLLEKGIESVVVFFSESGIEFAQKTGEKAPYFLYPIDTLHHAKKVLEHVDPRAAVVIRHELWPSFLFMTKKKKVPLFLANGSITSDETSFFKKFLKSSLYRLFDRIFVCRASDIEKFNRMYGCRPDQLLLTGDTKYDRVIERTQQKSSEINNGKIEKKTKEDKNTTHPYLPFNSVSTPTLIIGSAWQEDLTIILKAASEFIHERKLNLVVAPHKIDQSSIKTMQRILLSFSLKSRLISKEVTLPLETDSSIRVLILDTMGQLGDFYKLCDFAVVGGAFHHQVHNVLEPAANGLSIAFGPLYKNSHEAEALVKQNLAVSVSSHVELKEWIKDFLEKTAEEKNSDTTKLVDYVESLTGASEQIARHLS